MGIRSVVRNVLEYFPRSAMFIRSVRDNADRNAPHLQTEWGFTLSGNESMSSGEFEPEETAAVRKLLEEVDIFVNIGANVGYYCCHALSLGVPVIAIEPMARNLHYLISNVEKNGWSKDIEIFPVALGKEANILSMWGGGTGASLIKGWASIPESYVTRVPVLTLDRILNGSLQGKKALILADIEGAELLMLQGATQTLASNPDSIWMMEIASTENQPRKGEINPDFLNTFNVFYEKGFCSFIADSEFTSFSQSEVEAAFSNKSTLKSYNYVFRK